MSTNYFNKLLSFKISLLSLIGGQIYFQLVNDPLFTFTAPDNRPVFLYLFTLSNTPDYMPILRPSFIFDEPGTLVFVSMLQYAIVCMLKKGVPHSLFVLNFLLSFSTTGLAIAILIIIYRAFSRSGLMFKLFGMVSILSISFFSQNKIRAELNFDEIGRANLILRSFSDGQGYVHTGTMLDQFNYYNPVFGLVLTTCIIFLAMFIWLRSRRFHGTYSVVIFVIIIFVNAFRPRLLNFEFLGWALLIFMIYFNTRYNRKMWHIKGTKYSFFHVPKNAGTSIKRVLEPHTLGLSVGGTHLLDKIERRFYSSLAKNTPLIYLSQHPRLIRRDCVTQGHISVGDVIQLHPEYLTNRSILAVVRDPIDRLLSYFRYVKKSEVTIGI